MYIYICVISCNVKKSEVPVQVIKVYGVCVGVAPIILSLGAVGRWVINFELRPLWVDFNLIKQNESRLWIVRRGSKIFQRNPGATSKFKVSVMWHGSHSIWVPKSIRPPSVLAPGTWAYLLNSYQEMFCFYGIRNFFSEITKARQLDHIASFCNWFSL